MWCGGVWWDVLGRLDVMEAWVPSGGRCNGEFARGKKVVVLFFAIREWVHRLRGRWMGVELRHYNVRLEKGCLVEKGWRLLKPWDILT
jgi:hypothetical protein